MVLKVLKPLLLTFFDSKISTCLELLKELGKRSVECPLQIRCWASCLHMFSLIIFTCKLGFSQGKLITMVAQWSLDSNPHLPNFKAFPRRCLCFKGSRRLEEQRLSRYHQVPEGRFVLYHSRGSMDKNARKDILAQWQQDFSGNRNSPTVGLFASKGSSFSPKLFK